MSKVEGSVNSQHSNQHEVGVLDLVTCPLCDGKGELSRAYLYEKLGVRDMAQLATHTAQKAVTDLTDKLWTQYSDNLTKQVLAESARFNQEIERLKAARSQLEAQLEVLKDSMDEKESAARESQKNTDDRERLKEREALREEIAAVKGKLSEAESALSAAQDKRTIAVEKATLELRQSLTLADTEKQILAKKLEAAELELARLHGAKHERNLSAKGGIDFEVAAGAALRERIERLQDAYEETRNKTGGAIRNSRVGDHVQTLNPDSKGGGNLRVVYECKKEAGYARSDALKELATARENRQATVGVFVMAASTVREDRKVASEFSTPFTRFGSDILIVWDHEDPSTDIVLDVVVSAARALALRDVTEEAAEVDWTSIDRHLNGLATQVGHFAELKGWCGTIHDRTKDIEERLRIMEEQIKRDCAKLKEQLEALRP